MQKNRIIAIDYGKKRIGIAITDKNCILALPYKTIEAGNNLEESSKNILYTIQDYLTKTSEIVLGYPLLLNGKIGEMAQEVEKLKLLLSKKIDIKIILWDERLTSIQAEGILKDKKMYNMSRKKRSKKIDPIAATIILQSYLEAKSSKKRLI